MSRQKFAKGDRVIASLKSKIVGVVVDMNRFNDVLVEWPDGKRYWMKPRHLLLEIELDLMSAP